MALIATCKPPTEPKNIIQILRVVVHGDDGLRAYGMNRPTEAETVTKNPSGCAAHSLRTFVTDRAHPTLVGVLVRHDPFADLPAADETNNAAALGFTVTVPAVAGCDIAHSSSGGVVRIRNDVVCGRDEGVQGRVPFGGKRMQRRVCGTLNKMDPSLSIYEVGDGRGLLDMIRVMRADKSERVTLDVDEVGEDVVKECAGTI